MPSRIEFVSAYFGSQVYDDGLQLVSSYRLQLVSSRRILAACEWWVGELAAVPCYLPPPCALRPQALPSPVPAARVAPCQGKGLCGHIRAQLGR
jgi:hypothetical protein